MCDHQDFTSTINVVRLEDTRDGESVRCMVELTMSCTQCGKPLVFALPFGVNLVHGATMTLDGQTAMLTSRIGIPREAAMAGFSVNVL